MKFILAASLLILINANKYPVPLPKGGRRAVHGWLVLPVDQEAPDDGSVVGVDAWFEHHVPEFFTDSPHDFQIMLRGTLSPSSCVDGDLFPISIPLPPANYLLGNPYSFTPPSPFSLNDLLSGSTVELRGTYYNGSFDGPYERSASSLANLHIKELTTAVYLSEYENTSYPNLQYLSYPRGKMPSTHFYLAHDLHAPPDFNHIIHGTIDKCTIPASHLIYKAGENVFFVHFHILG